MTRSNRSLTGGQLEQLEARQLLAVSVKINFQPDTTNVPAGYIADIGKTYGSRGNGYSYGWGSANEANMRRRNSSWSPDARYDTFGRMFSTQKWEISVPNGTYDVRLVSGDPTRLDSYFKFKIESTTVMDAKPAGLNNWVERSARVTISDGRLTIAPVSGSSNGNLDFVEINTAASVPAKKSINWSKQSSGTAPISRVESGVVQVGNKLYVMGGYTGGYGSTSKRVDVLDLATKTWSRLADLPGSQTHAGVTSDGQYIYWASGQFGAMFSTTTTRDVWRFEIATNKWTKFVSLPAARFGGALAHVNGKLYFFGGTSSDRTTSQRDHWMLDLSNTAAGWVSKAPLPFAGDHLSHVVLDGLIYSIGGEHDHGKTYVQHDYMFAYNPSTNSWSRKANLPTPSSHFEGGTVVLNSKIFAISGQIDHEALTSEVRAYDPATNTWSLYSNFPEKRKGPAAGVYNGKIYFSGGDSYQNGQPRELWIGTVASSSSSASRSAAAGLAPATQQVFADATWTTVFNSLEW